MNPIRVLLADDEPSVRRGLQMRLALEPDIEVVGEAPDGDAVVALAEELHPDVVVMDIRMPGLDGLRAARRLLDLVPETSVVILTLHDDPHARVMAGAASCAGFVGKHEPSEALLHAIRCAAAGEPTGVFNSSC